MISLFLYRFPFTLLFLFRCCFRFRFRFRFLFPFPFLFRIPVSGFSRRPQTSVQNVLENRRKNERGLGPRREFPFDPVPPRFSLGQSSGSRVCISEHQWVETNSLDSVNHLLTKASPLSLLTNTHFQFRE